MQHAWGDERYIQTFGWKIPRGRPRRMWEYNIRTDLGEIGWEGADWIHLSQYMD
jgi:hypothetical protein